ncbi:rhomboid family intramembrane serine protease [Candidatus Electronema sp. PJ]|uniref:rhomboid family intramembrane serine protease n=1 Tax=Candidatus Electronema sp. PJ TaxID=3401572 RepID=UPI003AA97E46
MNLSPLSEPSVTWVLAAKIGPVELRDCSLMLSAIGIAHQVDRRSGVILVHRNNSTRAIAELQDFREENRNWPPPADQVLPFVRSSNWLTLLMLSGLILLHTISGPWLAASPWFAAGAVSSQAIIEQGQWWRLITALTLHADQGHLVGNCVIGGVMAHLLCKTLGSGTAWLAMLLSALLANFLNIALRTDPHYSVGFSTAVFAAIGIFCGRQLWGGGSLIRHLLLPLGAGASLLAMLGSGNEGGRTDLGAHLFGLACGLLCGFFLRVAGLDQQGSRRSLQNLFFFIALSLIILSWLLAFRKCL